MANITKDGRLRWTCPLTKTQKTLRVGKLGKSGKAFVVRVDALIGAIAAGEEPDAETRAWIRDLPAEMVERLSDAGLLGGGTSVPCKLSQFIDYFVQVRSGQVSASTRNHYQQAKDRAVQFFAADRDIRSITVGDVMAFGAWLRSKDKGKPGLGENTARKRCATLAAMMQLAVDCELIVKNPWADKRIQKGVQPASAERRFHLGHAEAVQIYEACRTTDKELATIFALTRWGGLRVGETLLLRWEHVDFEHGRLTVLSPKTANKGKDRRTLPLFPELRRALKELRQDAKVHELKIVPRYAAKTTQWAGTALERKIAQAGLNPWPRLWQNLRATRATELADRFPGHLCNEWLGHTENVAVASYRRATDEHYAMASRFETASTLPPSPGPAPPSKPPELRLAA